MDRINTKDAIELFELLEELWKHWASSFHSPLYLDSEKKSVLKLHDLESVFTSTKCRHKLFLTGPLQW